MAGVAILLAGQAAVALDLTPRQREVVIERAEEVVKSRAYAAGVDFEKRWPELLSKYKDRLEKAATEADLTWVINRALSELGISHIEMVTPATAKELNRTSMVGIGINHQATPSGVRVTRLVENAPAEKAGLRVGDEIIEVDGKPYERTDQIRGTAGTKVKVKVRREDGSETEYTITRAPFSTRQPEELIPLADDANVLVIPTFSAGYDRDSVERLFRTARKTPYLVLDLMDNGGGDFSNMMHFLSCLLPPRTAIGTQVSREMAERYALDTNSDASDPVAVAKWAESPVRLKRSPPIAHYTGKIAVLINGGSASASEIVAAALRELRDAPLVGSRTAGAVLVSTYASVGDGFLMKVPLSEWVTIKGVRLEGHPLVADVRVNTRRGSGEAREAARAEALRTLKAPLPLQAVE
jgi:carboxyl-terminal processing protease